MAIKSSEKRIEWINGMPVPTTTKPFTKESTKALINAAMSADYKPRYKIHANGEKTEDLMDGEEDYLGMAVGEVMIMRACDNAAWGDLDTFKYLMDRVVGKPVQATENLNVSGTLEEYLNIVAEQVSAKDIVNAGISEAVAGFIANPFATKETERSIQLEYGVFDNEAADFLNLEPMKELPKLPELHKEPENELLKLLGL